MRSLDEETACYCLTSSVMLSLTTNDESSGTFNLSGSIRRQVFFLFSFTMDSLSGLPLFIPFFSHRVLVLSSVQMNMDLSIAEGHLCNMGKMIEEMESKLRYSLDQVSLIITDSQYCVNHKTLLSLPCNFVKNRVSAKDVFHF